MIDNALRAQANLNIVNDLYKGADSEAGSSIIAATPAARAALEIMNKSTNQHINKFASLTPRHRGSEADAKSFASASKDSISEVRKRML